MTKDELEALLAGEELTKVLDVKTLGMDLLREMPEEEFLELFWRKLPELSVEHVKDYLYMRR